MAKPPRARTPPRPPPPRFAGPGWLAALAVGTLVLYWPTTGLGLTNWDDPEYVVNNHVAQRGLAAAWTESFDGAWYPVTQSVYAVVHAAGGGAAALHWIQVLLFALTVAMVPLALEGFGVPRSAGLAAAVLWAVHPFRPESVSWAANLKDTLAMAGLAGAGWLYGRRRIGPAVGLFTLALLAKSAFFGLGLLFPLAERVRGRTFTEAMRSSWGFVAVGGAVAVISGVLHLGKQATFATTEPLELVSTALWTPFWYLGRMVVPVGPRAVYGFPPVEPGSWRMILAVVLWLGVVALVARGPRSMRGGLVLVVAAVGLSLAPVSGVIPLRYLVADRYTLVPALAILAGLTSAVAARRTALNGPRWLLPVAVVVVAAFFIPSTVRRQREWGSAVALWESNLAHEPATWAVAINLASAYVEAGRLADAETATRAALTARPRSSDAMAQLFTLAAMREQVPEAELMEWRSTLLGSDFAQGEVLRAVEWAVGRSALHVAAVLLELVPGGESSGQAQRLWSVVERRRGNPGDAVNRARRALTLGEPRARVELIYALADAGRLEEALELSAVLPEDPLARALVRGARGYTLIKLGRTEEGEAEARAALEAVRSLSP